MRKSCDICHKSNLMVFVDGKTKMGPWANMCADCYDSHGRGVGLGLGQVYIWEDDKYNKIDISGMILGRVIKNGKM